ncbi:MAG: SpoIVB peptidase S55 domain-containing protein [Thermoanaerobaculia bacterium]
MSTSRRLGSPRAAKALVAMALCCATAGGAVEAPTIGLDEIHKGMSGYGLSVFSGAEPERFEVEVLGVLENLRPDASFVVARLSGRNLEETGVIAGMSGSPVYLDGRLAGAVAFSWPFAKEAIAGITPIRDMRAIGSPGSGPAGDGAVRPTAPAPEATDWSSLADPSAIDGEAALEKALAAFGRRLGGEREQGLLWTLAGFGGGARERLAAALPNLAPLSGSAAGALSPAGGDASPGALVPGGSVAALLVDGDLRMAATGTVTDRDGDRLLAFGHSILGLAGMSIPLATSEVITVFPSSYNSFKLSTVGRVVGAFVRDHPAGVAGVIGAHAETIPVELAITGDVERRYALRVADLPSLVPSLVAISCLGAWDAATGFAETKSVDLSLRLRFVERPPLVLEQSFDGTGAAAGAVSYVLAVLAFLEQNDLAPAGLRGIEVATRLDSSSRVARFVSARPDRTVVAPGQAVELAIELEQYDGTRSRRTERVVVPAELPDGKYQLLVGDGASISAAALAAMPAAPVNLDQVLELLESLRPARELGILGLLSSPGVSSGGEARPQLPVSVRSLWARAGARTAAGLKQAIVQRESVASDRPLAGLVRIDLEVRRDRKGEG